MATYICLGTPPFAGRSIAQIASAKRPGTWTIHRHARVGDSVLFYTRGPVSALVAKGTVAGDARKVTNRRAHWFGYYMAPVGHVQLLPREVGLDEIRKTFPRWGYWTQPRLSTRVPDEIDGKLQRLIAGLSREADAVRDLDGLAPAAWEGKKRWQRHLRRERSVRIRNLKRDSVLRATGRLACEACGFEFRTKYGAIGDGFCEVHHDRPIGSGGPRITNLRELRILCSNCHRMIHRTNPMLKVTAFRKLLEAEA